MQNNDDFQEKWQFFTNVLHLEKIRTGKYRFLFDKEVSRHQSQNGRGSGADELIVDATSDI